VTYLSPPVPYDFGHRRLGTNDKDKRRNRARVILDNYIIRIYRRDQSNPRIMVGVVEVINTMERKGFTTFEELREILISTTDRSIRYKHKKDRRKSVSEGG
jgi:hypothetical protein